MILSAHQPLYLPWQGFFQKIIESDKFCILDEVPFSRGDYISRNKILNQEKVQWISIPIQSFKSTNNHIKDIKIVDNGWFKKHLDHILHAYKRTSYFEYLFPEIQNRIIKNSNGFLIDLNMSLIQLLLDKLGLNRNIFYMSDLQTTSRKSELIMELCMKSNCDEYLSGINGKNYLDLDNFKRNEIKVFFQDIDLAEYPQKSHEFVPSLSVIDLIFNLGPNSGEFLNRQASSKQRHYDESI